MTCGDRRKKKCQGTKQAIHNPEGGAIVKDETGSPAWYATIQQQLAAQLPPMTEGGKRRSVLMFTDIWSYNVTPEMLEAMRSFDAPEQEGGWAEMTNLDQLKIIWVRNRHLKDLGDETVNHFLYQVQVRATMLRDKANYHPLVRVACGATRKPQVD